MNFEASNTERDSESDNEMTLFFHELDESEECLYYNYFQIINVDKDHTEVVFEFNFNNDVKFNPSMKVALPTEYINEFLVFNIGMCLLLWVWMGYGCQHICINMSKMYINKRVIEYWEEVYYKVMLEYIFVNKLQDKFVNGIKLTCPNVNESNAVDTDICNGNQFIPSLRVVDSDATGTLIPIGGGKDSLVVWQQVHEALKSKNPNKALNKGDIDGEVRSVKKDIELIYVADGLTEFEDNKRLKTIIETTGARMHHIVVHDNKYEHLQHRTRSYMKPCGHPWAALVLFDSLLVASALNTQQIGKNTDPRANVIGTVAFGFEQGANEGNGVFVNGLEVNHQYDKSEEFLSLTREYLGLMGRGSAPTSISALNDTPLLMRNKQALEENSFDTVRSTCADSDTALPLQTLCIYSPLANMTEIEIAKIFCTHPELTPFHSIFLSCNELDTATNPSYSWCNRCEKCAFVCLLCSAYLTPSYVQEVIFKHDLLSDDTLEGVFLSLLGEAHHTIACSSYGSSRNTTMPSKPFECVGTYEEVEIALQLTLLKFEELALPVPCNLIQMQRVVAKNKMELSNAKGVGAPT